MHQGTFSVFMTPTGSCIQQAGLPEWWSSFHIRFDRWGKDVFVVWFGHFCVVKLEIFFNKVTVINEALVINDSVMASQSKGENRRKMPFKSKDDEMRGCSLQCCSFTHRIQSPNSESKYVQCISPCVVAWLLITTFYSQVGINRKRTPEEQKDGYRTVVDTVVDFKVGR
jgi:hypothetical protein